MAGDDDGGGVPPEGDKWGVPPEGDKWGVPPEGDKWGAPPEGDKWEVPFFKVSGAGNDFIALIAPDRSPRPDEIRAWCRRGLSLGADGVFTLTRNARGARMVHYNADGGRNDLCLNASRCAAQLVLHLGWQEADSELTTDVGVLRARRVDGSRVALELPGILGEPEALVLAVGSASYEGWRLRVGVEHFVLPWPESLSRAPIAELGPKLRSHPELGPQGANVNFVRFPSSTRLEIRTFERGVEGETLACGTGVVAGAVAGVAAGRLELPVSALTSGGFELVIDGETEAGRLRRALVAGDARIVARGRLLPGAEALPSAPAWS
ncbi:MAG: diaminopimelate epimerase [bacterium]|nr:diaminopimelate epimerase [bacterium]